MAMSLQQLKQFADSFWETAKELFRPFNPLAIEIPVLWVVSTMVINLVRFVS